MKSYPSGTYFRVINTKGLAGSGISYNDIILSTEPTSRDGIVKVNNEKGRWKLYIGENVVEEYLTTPVITNKIKELKLEIKNLDERLKWLKESKKQVFDLKEYSIENIAENLIALAKGEKNEEEIKSAIIDLVSDLTNHEDS